MFKEFHHYYWKYNLCYKLGSYVFSFLCIYIGFFFVSVYLCFCDLHDLKIFFVIKIFLQIGFVLHSTHKV